MNIANESFIKWIRNDLNDLLNDARVALEDFAERSGNLALMAKCCELLHKLHGTLQMVQLYGAAMLAEEMELLAKALQDGELAKIDEATAALMMGLVQLPDHLDAVEDGALDSPMSMLSLFNELRAARKVPLFTELSLFGIDLEHQLQEQPVSGIPSSELSEIARRLRPKFHRGLLKWFRSFEPEEGILQIGEVVDELSQHAGTDRVRDLFAAAGALTALLAERSLEAGVAAKVLIGKVDREMKHLIDSGEGSLLDALPVDLFKNILYYVAHSDSQDRRVLDLRERFHLSPNGGHGADEADHQASVGGLNRELLSTVSGAINEDLAKIKGELDLYIRMGTNDTGRLEQIRGPLEKLADTLGMLGQGSARLRLKEQADRVKGWIVFGEIPEDGALLEVAAALLTVEDDLQDLALGTTRSQRANRPKNLDPTNRRLLAATLHEATIDMAHIKEAISAYLANPEDNEQLKSAGARFKSVQGALQILRLDEPARMLSNVAQYVASRMGAGTVPPQDEIDALADVIASIEYFMESVVDDLGHREDLLEYSRGALRRLGNTDEAVVDSLCPTELEVDELAVLEKENIGDETVLPVIPYVPELVPQVEAVEVDEAGPDSDILSIFIEEAGEELVALREGLLVWLGNPADQESLNRIRRSFHTLKGSGRLVGAEAIGEFSWSMENLLNRVLSGIISANAEVQVLLQESVALLPSLIEAESRKRPPADEYRQLMERAFALSEGRDAPPESSVADLNEQQVLDEELAFSDLSFSLELLDQEESTQPLSTDEVFELQDAELDQSPIEFELLDYPEPLPFDGDEELKTEELDFPLHEEGGVPVAPAPIMLDETLLEIFAAESLGHLRTLQNFLQENADSESGCLLNNQVTRALHTLHGSANMAEVEPIARVSKANERYFDAIMEHHLALFEDDLQLLGETIEIIQLVLKAINQPGGQLPAWESHVEKIERRMEQLETSVVAAVPDELDDLSEGLDLSLLDLSEFLDDSQPENSELEPGAATAEEVVAMAAPAQASPINESAQMPSAELDEELLSIFLEEAQELSEGLESALHAWQVAPGDRQSIAQMQRVLHTMKGAARLAGVSAIGDLSHAFESLLIAIERGTITADQRALQLAQQVTDQIITQVERLGSQLPVPSGSALITQIEVLQRGEFDRQDAVSKQGETDNAAQQDKELAHLGSALSLSTDADSLLMEPSVLLLDPGFLSEAPADTASPAAAQRNKQEMIRVRLDQLDRMVNNAGEISIYRTRIEQQHSEIGFNLSEFEQAVSRLKQQLRTMELETEAQILFRFERDQDERASLAGADAIGFDPLEMDRFSTIQQMSRSLAETVNDLASIRVMLSDLNREAATLMLQQARVTNDLRDGLLRTRMVTFEQVVPRLQRLVRQTAQLLGKEAELVVTGAGEEMDRTILNRIVAPLEHILRNALSHGIESADQRRAMGKAALGRIELWVVREGRDVAITVKDDGAGVDAEAVRKRAIERGLLGPDIEIAAEDLVQFLLEPGFSTASTVTQISGRGVGMDVVSSEVKQMGGTLEMETRAGHGTSFKIKLPFTLALTEALLVKVGDEIFAIPYTSIEGVTRVPLQELVACYRGEQQMIQYAGRNYRPKHLGELLELTAAAVECLDEQRKWLPCLLVRHGEHGVAIQVDQMVGSRQIVVKPVGVQMSTIRWITGGTILGDGRVALILDISALARLAEIHQLRIQGETATVNPAVSAAAGGTAEVKPITVMVVDDSITVRKVTSRLLTRHNMNVISAKDGVDALAKLQETIPDVMLLDVEMPRMDGYELARHIRHTVELKQIPIIMITSRTGEKHRRHALELGVDIYLGKPYQEGELLEHIYALLAEKKV